MSCTTEGTRWMRTESNCCKSRLLGGRAEVQDDILGRSIPTPEDAPRVAEVAAKVEVGRYVVALVGQASADDPIDLEHPHRPADTVTGDELPGPLVWEETVRRDGALGQGVAE